MISENNKFHEENEIGKLWTMPGLVKGDEI